MIVIHEESELIQKFTERLEADVAQTLQVLNRIFKHHTGEIPESPDEFLLDRLKENPQIKAMALWRRFTINDKDLILPADIMELKSAFADLKGREKFIQYCKRTKNGWLKDDAAVSKDVTDYTEKQRIYARTPEEILRHGIAEKAVQVANEVLKHTGLDITTDTWGTKRRLIDNFLIQYYKGKYRPAIGWIQTGSILHIQENNPM